MAHSRSSSSSRPNPTGWIILSCFFASGMTGLVYQVVWVRELVLVFGSTTFAVSTVLTAFMGGLALGSFLVGRRASRISRPLRIYGWLEVGIGLYAVAVPIIFSALPYLYRPLWQQLYLSFFALSLTRFVFAALVLIVPTALMGATLPALAAFYARDFSRIGFRVGLLYTMNTFGAMLGVAATGFVLIPNLGMQATTLTAAAINLLLGVVALRVDKVYSEARIGDSTASPLPPVPRDVEPRKRRALAIAALAAFAISGFVALSFEVIWSRVLALIIGSSVYAFTLMLTTFLVGLAAGASVGTRFADRIRNPMLAFGLVELGIGASALAGAFLFNDLPFAFVRLYGVFEDASFGLLLLARFLVASLVMIVPTFLLGALFPLVIRIVGEGGGARSTGQAVGDSYAANTAGAIAGSFVSGFLLIPWLGLLGSIQFCVGLNFVLAAALCLLSSPALSLPKSKTSRVARMRLPVTSLASAGVAMLAVGATFAFDPPWDSDVMSSAVYRYAPSMSKMSRGEFDQYIRDGQGDTIFYKEGITATVAVQKSGDQLVLKINGKPEASTAGDMPTQVLIGSLPLLVRPSTSEALVIGLGSGVTLGSVQRFPVKRVTCVELEPAVVEASHYFNHVNNRPLEDPRLRLVANDGRNFMFTTSERFDVIISEPSNPWLTGVANLFTLEYFKRGADLLTEDGVFSQWLQIYEMSPGEVRSLVGTFQAAFAHTYVFRGAEGDLMLLGARRELRFDPSLMAAHLADARIAADHRRVGVASPHDVISRLYLGPEQSRRFSGDAPLNTDDNALIEFSAPRHVGTKDLTVEVNVRELLAYAGSPGELLAAPLDQADKAQFLTDCALSAIKRDDKARAEQLAGHSLEVREMPSAYSVLGELRFARDDGAGALEAWERALALDPDHFFTLINVGKLYLTRLDTKRAGPYIDRALQIRPESARAFHLRALVHQSEGEMLEAVRAYRRALADGQYTRSVPSFYLNFGTALSRVGFYDESAELLEDYVMLVPGDADGQFHLGAVYQIQAERSLDDGLARRAIDRLKQSLSLNPELVLAHYYLSKAYRQIGLYDRADAEFELYERLAP